VNNADPSGQSYININIPDMSGVNAFFNQMAADNAAMDLSGCIRFASSMSSFRASIHIGNIASAVSGVTAWSRAFSTFVNRQKAGAIIGQMFQNLGHILGTSAHNARTRESGYQRSAWDTFVSGFNRTVAALANNPLTRGIYGGLEIAGGLVSQAFFGVGAETIADGMMNIDLAVKDFIHGNFFGEDEYRWRHGYQQQSN
jgi:hypothetical protein